MSTARIIRRAALASAAGALAILSAASASAYERLDQGGGWDEAAWNAYYTLDQGSRLIPYAWAKALKTADGASFADGLTRYGYLPNPENKEGLPVGFMVADGELGLNCAACHTRQIEYGGKAYRIDGGPAIADIGTLWADLDVAVGKVLDEKAFPEFARAVLGSAHSPEKEKALHEEVDLWHKRHHAITERGLKAPGQKPWGYGRLDAVGMILNRVTGLDIGETSPFILPENIQPADAPVRPPFLWNAWRQDRTQWPGFAPNGDRALALARNVGQVYGVFGKFHPEKDPSHLLKFNFVKNNSTNFLGLVALERLIEKIDPPKWPWPLDESLADEGKAIYERPTAEGGCSDCHGIKPGVPRVLNPDTWCTPLHDVGTDAREYKYMAGWPVKTGVLKGAALPSSPALGETDNGILVLSLTVRGAIAQTVLPVLVDPNDREKADNALKAASPLIAGLEERLKSGKSILVSSSPFVSRLKQEMEGVYQMRELAPRPAPEVCPAPSEDKTPKYEARVLRGIWAAAPYLHNGSVPTLADLLKPAKDRPARFKIGPAYDVTAVGLAADQTGDAALDTDDCTDKPAPAHSGNGHCGHNYGTTLPEADKKALLEYLKKL